MTLIIGGAWQGKLSWAVKEYNFTDSDLCDLAQGFLPGKRCYYHLEAVSRRGERCDFPADSVVISREIGSGVVPVTPEERAWREAHGLLLRELAARSERVVRIFCGIPEVLR